MSINVKDLKLDIVKTLEGLLLVEKPRAYDLYEEGIKKGIAGFSFTCISEGLKYEKLVVKIPGMFTPPFEFQGTPLSVTFEGLEGKVWQDFNNHGELKLSVTATNIVPTSDNIRLKINTENKK